MRTWLLLLGGLIVWAAHFSILWGASSIFPGTASNSLAPSPCPRSLAAISR